MDRHSPQIFLSRRFGGFGSPIFWFYSSPQAARNVHVCMSTCSDIPEIVAFMCVVFTFKDSCQSLNVYFLYFALHLLSKIFGWIFQEATHLQGHIHTLSCEARLGQCKLILVIWFCFKRSPFQDWFDLSSPCGVHVFLRPWWLTLCFSGCPGHTHTHFQWL